MVADTYLTLTDEGRSSFFRMLADDFWTDANAVDAAVRELRLSDERRAPERALRAALTPAVTDLLHLFTGLDGGVKFLVDLRADTLRLRGDDEALRDLDGRDEVFTRHTLRCRAARAAPHHLGRAREPSREADLLRSGAHDPVVGRPEEPSRLR